MTDPTMTDASLTVGHPRPNQEFPVGVDFVVTGTAMGTWVQLPEDRRPRADPIRSVTVQIDNELPVVQARFAPSPTRPPDDLAVEFSATIRLNNPGEHQLNVRAGGHFSGATEAVVAVMTPGTTTTRCKVGVWWINYPLTHSLFRPYRTCTPESLAGIVAIVREAEAANKRVHAFGSKWSFSDCALTSDYLVDTRQLKHPLKMEQLRSALRGGQDSSRLYHVEAGITIRGLYENLNRLGLALETMGGASGQTLAGAISTGTHGADKFMAPLADSVVAIHLVGAGGTQYWIEPSAGITDPALLKANVAPDVDPWNIIYDDATFDACLVSLGCMGVIYAVVLRVREPYDLVETTVETTWRAFKESASTHLNDPSNRFLQILLNPYKDDNDENLCLLTTRSEASPEAGPLERPRGDVDQAEVDSWNAIRSTMPSFLWNHLPEEPPSAVELVVWTMILSLRPFPFVQMTLNDNGVFDATGLSNEERLARIVQGILTHAPDQRPVLVAHYWPIMRAQWPTRTLRGSSYSVMDIGYGRDIPSYQRGYSIELHFPAIDENGRLGFVDFVDALIAAVNAATETFFAGYVSLRFTGGPTRAYLGMQQWNQTCSVEISVVQDVQGLFELLSELFRMGFNLGGLPHWGQELDLGGVQGRGSLYPQYARWRHVYARMSNYFTTRTFENELSSRWKITTPDGPSPAPIASNALLLLEEKTPAPIASNALLLLEEKTPVPIASNVLLLLGD